MDFKNINLPVPGLPTTFRCLTIEKSGQIKEITVDKEGDPIVNVWYAAETEASKHVVAASLDTKRRRLVVARIDGTVDLFDSGNGNRYCRNIQVVKHGEGDIVGLHARPKYSERKRSCNIITCTTMGVVLILSLKDDGTYKVKNRWELSFSPKFCQMDTTEDYFSFGGSTNELCVWKVEEFLWKPFDPQPAGSCLLEPGYTCAAFMHNEDRVLVAGHDLNKIIVCDAKDPNRIIRSQVTSHNDVTLNYGVPTAIAIDLSDKRVYVGNEFCDLASVDITSGRVVHFENVNRRTSMDNKRKQHDPIQKNGIKFIALDTKHHFISSGLDNHLRIWNEDTGKLCCTVYPMLDLVNVIFDHV